MAMLFPTLEPSRKEISAMMDSAESFVADFLGTLSSTPAVVDTSLNTAADLLTPPSEEPRDFGELLDIFRASAARAVDTAGPGCFAYFPGGGVFSAAVAEMLARTVNRYTGSSSMALDLVAMEHSVIRWLCDEFDLPAGAGGLTTTGASTGTLSAIVAARQAVLGGPGRTGTIYVTAHTHHSAAKSARIAGFPPELIRVVPVSADLRMDPQAAEDMIKADRAAGMRPFMIVGTAGSTNSGTIDPLNDLAEVARSQELWYHVDAAYGGGFQLTARGKAKLAGISRADSITMDLHKSMFMPYTTGVLLVRNVQTLHEAHVADAEYLQDLTIDDTLPNYADLGHELSREYRGLRLWLPLHLHGVGAFRAALDEKLDLSAIVHRELSNMPAIETTVPDLTVHLFRTPGRDEANSRLLKAINSSGRVALTSTRIFGRNTLRMCVLNHRTRCEHVDEARQIIIDSTRLL